MNHRQRWTACQAVSRKLISKYGTEILATGVTGSVSRGADMDFSDVDFQILVKERARVKSHRFVLKGCLFSVAARTVNDWMKEMIEPNFSLPLVVGSLKSMRIVHDPDMHFDRLRLQSESLAASCWRNAVRVGLEEMTEDLGRLRNVYAGGDWINFRRLLPLVALEATLVYSSLREQAVLSENDLLDAKLQGYDQKFARALLTGFNKNSANHKRVTTSLEWVYNVLREAAEQCRSAPVNLESIASYVPHEER